MRFKIDFPINSNLRLNYKTPILTMGSCFAESIAEKLVENRFDVTTNPNGILYNPISIANALEPIVSGDNDIEDAIFFDGELWHSWRHHGRFSHPDKQVLLDHIQTEQHKLSEVLTCDKATIVITFGSATTYSLNGKVVANCHKQPQKNFEQKRLTLEEMVLKYEELLARYKSHQFVFTVSPVRYSNYGQIESNRNKSVLLLAIDELVANYSNAEYFPSYEIVIDELRDYRYYDSDLAHPNQLAVDYVWQRFVETCLDNESKKMMTDWSKVSKLLNHRVLHPSTESSARFEAKRKSELANFNKRYF